jgi:hypothetical protein
LSHFNKCRLTDDKSTELLTFKLIDLSDEAILKKAFAYIQDSNIKWDDDFIDGYTEALNDLKQPNEQATPTSIE